MTVRRLNRDVRARQLNKLEMALLAFSVIPPSLHPPVVGIWKPFISLSIQLCSLLSSLLPPLSPPPHPPMPLSDLQAFTDHSIASGREISWSLNGNWTLFQTWIWKLRSCRFFLLFIVLSLLVLPLTDGLTKVNVSEFVTRLTTDWTNMYRWFQSVDVLLCCLGDGRILSCNS